MLLFIASSCIINIIDMLAAMPPTSRLSTYFTIALAIDVRSLFLFNEFLFSVLSSNPWPSSVQHDVCHLPGCYLFITLIACIVLCLSRKALTKRRDIGHRNINIVLVCRFNQFIGCIVLAPTLDYPPPKRLACRAFSSTLSLPSKVALSSNNKKPIIPEWIF